MGEALIPITEGPADQPTATPPRAVVAMIHRREGGQKGC